MRSQAEVLWYRAVIRPAALLVACTFVVGASSAAELEIKLDSDSVPAIATVVGPQSLLDRAAEVAKLRDGTCKVRQVFIQFNFGINWGDDARLDTHATSPVLGPDGCEDWLKHRYTVPGTYRIKAGLYHLGPTDEGITDWQSERSVTLGGTPAKLDLSLVDAVGGKTVLYQSPLPVEWELATGAPAELKLELVGENGRVAVTQVLTGLSYAGRGKTNMRLQGRDYDDLVRPDMVPAFVRATLTSQGQSVVRESAPFTLSSEIVFSSPDTAPRTIPVDGQPRAIKFIHHSYFPTCHGYLIDWGDGSPVERKVTDNRPQGCVTKTLWTESTHSYAEPGSYRIKLRVTDFAFNEPPENSPFYQAVTVTVP